MTTAHAPEEGQSLVTLAAPLAVWAAHFVFAYAFSAVVCAKAGPLLVLRGGIAVATVLAMVLVARMGVKARRRAPSPPVGERVGVRGDSSGARFLSFVTQLIAGLAAVAILYNALVFVLIRDCK